MAGSRRYSTVGYRGPPEDERPEIWNWLNDDYDDGDKFYVKFVAERGAVAKAWARHRGTIIERFAKLHPGHRPRYWWFERHDQPRQRVGGIGEPYDDTLHLGAHCFFKGPGFDWTNTPTYESEPCYLRRLDLLLPSELARLRPEDFEAVHVEISLPERGMFCPICSAYISVVGWKQYDQCPHCHTGFSTLRERIEHDEEDR